MKVEEAVNKLPVIGILRGFTQEQVFRILEAYQECGFLLAEITWNTPDAAMIIEASKQRFPDLIIGAGTVVEIDDYYAAKDSGAEFIVTPILNDNVINQSVKDSIPIFPGAFSPTEIHKAWALGATMVKVFPSGTLSHGYIKELQGPFPQIPLVPTGGITIENVELFLKAGAKGLGVGGGLFPSTLIKAGDWDDLRNHFLAFKKQIQSYTG